MVFDLIDKLIDRLIKLVEHKQEVRRKSIEDFVKPVIEQFELVHNGYLASFREYRNTIQKARNVDVMLAALIPKVEADNLFSANERAKLWSLAKWNSYGSTEAERLVMRVAGYLIGVESDLVDDLSRTQKWRNSLLFELRDGDWHKEHAKSTTKRKKEVLINILDDVLDEMQGSYAEVREAYAALNHKYLRY